jgi:predicted acylesterase/phospholipase RssA
VEERVVKRSKVGLALAGGGPFGAVYELGVLLALQESLQGIELDDLDCYVGVSAGCHGRSTSWPPTWTAARA